MCHRSESRKFSQKSPRWRSKSTRTSSRPEGPVPARSGGRHERTQSAHIRGGDGSGLSRGGAVAASARRDRRKAEADRPVGSIVVEVEVEQELGDGLLLLFRLGGRLGGGLLGGRFRGRLARPGGRGGRRLLGRRRG